MRTPRLERLTLLVERELARVLPKAAHGPPPIPEAMRYCVLAPGKRFRPLLCLGACEASGSASRRALPVACAIELIHAYSLVHDDLPAMDNADTRRGQPSCHRKYGEANAILVGDALLTLAFELLSRNGTPNTLTIIRTIGQASGTVGLIGGQALDLVWSDGQGAKALARLEDVAKRKTAALITASVVAGGLAGQASASQLGRLRHFGRQLGLAFQLIDDVHDGEGFAQAMGRDAARQKAHRLIAHASRHLAPFGRRAEVLQQLGAWLEHTA